MSVKVGINGFGRMGRLALRTAWIFQLGGLPGCLWPSAGFVLAAGALSLLLRAQGAGATAPGLAVLRADGD